MKMNEIKSYDEMLDTLKDVRNYLKISRADDCVDELDKVARYLINKNNNKPTEEEVLKEFEALGYKKYNTDYRDYIELRNEEKGERICIDLDIKTYMKLDTDIFIMPFGITPQEHQLLTKLFKAWGWVNE